MGRKKHDEKRRGKRKTEMRRGAKGEEFDEYLVIWFK